MSIKDIVLAIIGASILNKFTAIGMPISVRVA